MNYTWIWYWNMFRKQCTGEVLDLFHAQTVSKFNNSFMWVGELDFFLPILLTAKLGAGMQFLWKTAWYIASFVWSTVREAHIEVMLTLLWTHIGKDVSMLHRYTLRCGCPVMSGRQSDLSRHDACTKSCSNYQCSSIELQKFSPLLISMNYNSEAMELRASVIL